MVKVGQINIQSLVKALKQVNRLTQGPRSRCKFDPVRAVEVQGARYHSIHRMDIAPALYCWKG